jgi:tRNA(Arg) A34 adenosine deaminase TadA
MLKTEVKLRMIENSDAYFMRMAIDLATANVVSGAGGPFGAVVVKNGTVVATGVNQVTATHDPTAHAEVTAIRAATAAMGHFELIGCTIYSSCEPCPMCLGAIYWSRLDALYFGSTAQDAAAAGFDDAFIYEEIGRQPPERRVKTECLMRDDAAESFDAWKTFAGKIAY